MDAVKWHSFHLSYNYAGEELDSEDHARRLFEAIYKCLKTATATAPPFFFVRYFDEESGAHIRLRLWAIDAAPFVQLFCDLPPDVCCRVTIETYVPETARYGGSQTLSVVEAFFARSSLFYFEYLLNSDCDKLLMSIALKQLFIKTLQISASVASVCFRYCCENWMARLEQETGIKRSTARADFDALFEEQQTVLETFVRYLQESSDEWLTEWRSICADFTTAMRQHPPEVPAAFAAHLPREWFVYQSVLHLTDNRLGISNADEVYLSHLLCRWYEQKAHLEAPFFGVNDKSPQHP